MVEGSVAGDLGEPPSKASDGSLIRRPPISVPIQFSATLVPLDGVAELPFDDVHREGGSRPAVALMGADFASYYCKSPVLIPGHRFIGANELLAGRLARLAGLPVRPVELIRWAGDLYVGSQLLEHDRKMTGPLSADTWGRLVNAPGVAYNLVAFDVWILNEDRHDGNWLGGVTTAGSGMLLAMDHDLSLLGQGRSAADLVIRAGTGASEGLVRSQVLRDAIEDRSMLRAAAANIERIDDRSLNVNISQLPDEWVGQDERAALFEVLKARRDNLWDLLSAAPATLFPNLRV